MGFDPKLLNPNEEVVLDLRPHWWFIVPQVATVVGTLVLAGVAIALGAPLAARWVAAALVLFAALALVWRWFEWNGDNFVITTDRLISRAGVVRKRGIEIPLEHIHTVQFNQKVRERMIGKGQLIVESAGENGRQFFPNVARPNLVQQEIYRAIEINKNQEFEAMAAAHAAAAQAAPPPDAAHFSVADEIDKLDQLRMRGVLTEAEFQAKKAELLDRM